jgi:hypothetical protein
MASTKYWVSYFFSMELMKGHFLDKESEAPPIYSGHID